MKFVPRVYSLWWIAIEKPLFTSNPLYFSKYFMNLFSDAPGYTVLSRIINLFLIPNLVINSNALKINFKSGFFEWVIGVGVVIIKFQNFSHL